MERDLLVLGGAIGIILALALAVILTGASQRLDRNDAKHRGAKP